VIISRTPLRISFVGEGTDLKAFYEVELGAIVGTTINKYMYINEPVQMKARGITLLRMP